MGRLIDADLFKQQMSALALTSPSFFTSKVVKLLEIIDKQPTAFDVEAVVNGVREAGAKLCANKCCNNNCDCCVVDDSLRTIIDAIKKGGVK